MLVADPNQRARPRTGGSSTSYSSDIGRRPQTAHTVEVYAIGPLRILLILLLAAVLSHLVGRICRGGWSARCGSSRLWSGARRGVRSGPAPWPGSFASVSRVVIWIVAILTILGQLQINLLPFVATQR